MWKMQSIENEECGKCRVWKMGVWKIRNMENVEHGKCRIWKLQSLFLLGRKP